MYIITETETNVYVTKGKLKEYWDNGYPIITDENGNDCAYPTGMFTLHETDVPDGVEPQKYCYTPEQGFYENENYKEPTAYDLVSEDVLDAILDQYNLELLESGVL
jgi:hypothetical protein